MRLNNIFPLLSALWVLSEILVSVTMTSRAGAEDHDRSTLRLLWLVIMLAVAAGIVVAGTGLGAVGHFRQAVHLAGVLLIAVGLVVRWSAILTLKHYFTVNVALHTDHKIIDAGLYRHVRHPAYTGSLLSFFGLGLALVNWLSLALVFLPVLAAFLVRIKQEEKVLHQRFGSGYADYCAETKRLLPWLY